MSAAAARIAIPTRDPRFAELDKLIAEEDAAMALWNPPRGELTLKQTEPGSLRELQMIRAAERWAKEKPAPLDTPIRWHSILIVTPSPAAANGGTISARSGASARMKLCPRKRAIK